MKKINLKSITVQLILIFLVLFFVIFLYTGMNFYLSMDVISSYKYVDRDIYNARKFAQNIEKVSQNSYFYAKNKVEYSWKDVESSLQKAVGYLDKISSQQSEEYHKEQLDQIRYRYDRLQHHVDMLLCTSAEEDRMSVYRQIYQTSNSVNNLTNQYINSLINGYGNLNEKNKQNMHQITLLFWSVFSLMLILLFFILKHIIKHYTYPIQRLITHMSMMGHGEFIPIQPTAGVIELTTLHNRFNQMAKELLLLIGQIKVETRIREQLKFRLLQEQINPHFLYNTMEMIIWKAESGDQQKIIEIVKSLSSFFRLTLSNGDEIVTVIHEVRHIENYLFLQMIRYMDILSYDIKVDERVHALYMPKICLQPIVENAIYHGIKPSRSKGHIHIDIRLQGNKLLLSVSDNGVGMPAEKLTQLRQKLYGNSFEDLQKKSNSGFGLVNVHQRIKLRYGDEYGVFIYSEQGKGTTVCIFLPIQQEFLEDED